MQCLSSEEAIDWVDQNARQILGHARKYLPFAPYDQEDFRQDAYEAALEAARVSAERDIPFPACFWILFKGKISDVTPFPGSRRNAGSCSPPSTFCDWTDFSTKVFGQATSADACPSQPIVDIDQIYSFIRPYLTVVENQVLELIFGIHDGPMKIRETARHLGCSPANVRQTLNRVCNRLSLLVQSGELKIQLVDGEIVGQQAGPACGAPGYVKPHHGAERDLSFAQKVAGAAAEHKNDQGSPARSEKMSVNKRSTLKFAPASTQACASGAQKSAEASAPQNRHAAIKSGFVEHSTGETPKAALPRKGRPKKQSLVREKPVQCSTVMPPKRFPIAAKHSRRLPGGRAEPCGMEVLEAVDDAR